MNAYLRAYACSCGVQYMQIYVHISVDATLHIKVKATVGGCERSC